MCRALSFTARATWEMVTDSLDQRLADVQPRMIEERAITDVAMLLVRRMSPGEADVTLFTQGQEATTGADFELLIYDEIGSYVGFLVQAKGLKPNGSKEGYPALGERDGAVMQYEKLLAACGPGTEYPDHGALHVFYNGELLESAQSWPDDQCAHPASDDEPARGITIAPTSDIAAAIESGRRSYRYDRIAPECWPWWCFFCCAGGGLANLAQRSSGRRTDHSGGTDAGGPDDGTPGRRSRIPKVKGVDDAPDYVRAARRREGRHRIVELPVDGQRPAASTVVVLEIRPDK